MTISKQTKVMSLIVVIVLLFIMIGSATTVFGYTSISETLALEYVDYVNSYFVETDSEYIDIDTSNVMVFHSVNNGNEWYMLSWSKPPTHSPIKLDANGDSIIWTSETGEQFYTTWVKPDKSYWTSVTQSTTTQITDSTYDWSVDAIWSNYDVYDTGGSLLHSADYGGLVDASWYSIKGFTGDYVDFYFTDLDNVETFNLHMYQEKLFGEEYITTWYFDNTTDTWRFDYRSPYWTTYKADPDKIRFEVTWTYSDQSSEVTETILPEQALPTKTTVIKPKFILDYDPSTDDLTLRTNYTNTYQIDLVKSAYTNYKVISYTVLDEVIPMTADAPEVIYNGAIKLGEIWDLFIRSEDGSILYGSYRFDKTLLSDNDYSVGFDIEVTGLEYPDVFNTTFNDDYYNNMPDGYEPEDFVLHDGGDVYDWLAKAKELVQGMQRMSEGFFKLISAVSAFAVENPLLSLMIGAISLIVTTKTVVIIYGLFKP